MSELVQVLVVGEGFEPAVRTYTRVPCLGEEVAFSPQPAGPPLACGNLTPPSERPAVAHYTVSRVVHYSYDDHSPDPAVAAMIAIVRSP